MKTSSPEIIESLLEFAHQGAVAAIAEAQRRLVLLERFENDAILCPPLHAFASENQSADLTALAYTARLRETIDKASRVGTLCEQAGQPDNQFKKELVDWLARDAGFLSGNCQVSVKLAPAPDFSSGDKPHTGRA